MTDPTFWPTFWATTAGATVGVAGVIGVFRRESKERYEARLTAALTQVCYEIRECFPVGDDPSKEFILENSMRLSIALDVATMVARGEDAELLHVMSDALLEMKVDGGESVRNLLHKVLISIYGWRSKARPREFYVEWVKAE